MKTYVIAATTSIFLTGCAASPQENCRSYGLTPGTDAYAQCIGDESRNNRNNSRERMRDFNRANEARGGSVGNYCPIGLQC
jgi:hypothetical protein